MKRILLLVIQALSLSSILTAQTSGAEASVLARFQTWTWFPLTTGTLPRVNADTVLTPAGKWQVGWLSNYGNIYRFDNGVRLPNFFVMADAEGSNHVLTLRYGLLPGLEVRGWLEGLQLYGGFLDPLLAGFHTTFGFANQGREARPDNQMQIMVRRNSQVMLDLRTAQAGLSSSGLSLTWKPVADWPLWLSARGKLPVPAPTGFLFSGLAAAGVGAHTNWTWEFLEGGFDLGWSWQDHSGLVQLVPWRPGQWEGGARLFWHVDSGLALGLEGAYSQSPFDTIEDYLGLGSGNLWLGARWRLGPDLILETALQEELFTWAALEVSFQTGLIWRPEF